MKKPGGAAVAALSVVLLAGCAGPAPAPTVTGTTVVTEAPTPAPTVTVTVTPTATAAPPAAPPASGSLDLTTDEGLCAADAELSNLELNDALAPLLGYPADRDLRTIDQDQALRDYKNAAFLRACPARAS